jgi:hypothetical protein
VTLTVASAAFLVVWLPRSKRPRPNSTGSNKGMFIAVGGRQDGGATYETYLVE